MKFKLSRDEFVPFAPERKGTVRRNHIAQSCSGESDSLRITRNEDGTISAKCFRCGATGFYSPERSYRPAESRHPRDAIAIGGGGMGISLPQDSTSTFSEFPRQVRDWLVVRGGIRPDVSEAHGILWSDEAERLYIPVVQETSADGPIAVGYVVRRFQPKRYRTLTKDRERFWGLLRASERHSEVGVSPAAQNLLIIVEDMISGLRCREISDTMVLCGTELKSDAFATILKEGYKEAVIFLDSDNPTVVKATRTIQRKLFWMKTRIIETGRDPKSYNREQLEELING